jgi:hypothetical protein
MSSTSSLSSEGITSHMALGDALTSAICSAFKVDIAPRPFRSCSSVSMMNQKHSAATPLLALFSKMLVAVDMPTMRPTKPCRVPRGSPSPTPTSTHVEYVGDVRYEMRGLEVVGLDEKDNWERQLIPDCVHCVFIACGASVMSQRTRRTDVENRAIAYAGDSLEADELSNGARFADERQEPRGDRHEGKAKQDGDLRLACPLCAPST